MFDKSGWLWYYKGRLNNETKQQNMQTFLISSDYQKSAKCLDNKRLGNQRNENFVLLNTNLGFSNSWKNHPICKMWRGYEYSLARYSWEIIQEWKRRGYKDSCESKLLYLVGYKDFIFSQDPPWLGDEKFHSSHRAALLFKKYDWYSQFGWTEKPELNYVWYV